MLSKAEFSSSLLQFSVSRDPSEIILNYADLLLKTNRIIGFQDSKMNKKV